MTKYVYDFSEGNKDMKDLLGGKGANLAEMTNMGLPVPPGFTITTEACLTLPGRGRRPGRAARRGRGAPAARSKTTMGSSSATPTTRCSCRVRSGAKFSMPGMMDTVLNLGLNDESRRRASPSRPMATSASRGTPTAGSSRCSGRP